MLASALVVITLLGLPAAYWAGARNMLGMDATSGQSPADSGAVSSIPTTVYAEGKLLPQGGLIEVPLMPGDRLETLNVKSGDRVEAGDELAQTAKVELAKLQWELASASQSEAAQQLEQRLAAATAERIRAEAALRQLQVESSALLDDENGKGVLDRQLEQARLKLGQLERLASDRSTGPLVSTFEVAEQRLEVEKLETQLDQQKKSARVALDAAAETLEQAQKAERLLQTTSLTSFDKQVELAKKQWEETIVRAPRQGKVLKVLMEPGETASTSPLLLLADVSVMQCVAEVHQASVQFVQQGQAVRIESPALPRALNGKVIRSEQIVGKSSLENPNPLSPKDTSSVEVIIQLDQESQRLASSFVNLQVTVEITVSGEASTATAEE